MFCRVICALKQEISLNNNIITKQNQGFIPHRVTMRVRYKNQPDIAVLGNTYLNTWNKVDPEKLIGSQIVKKFMRFNHRVHYRVYKRSPYSPYPDPYVPRARVRPVHLRFILIWHAVDRAAWYILITKANKMHSFSNLFHKVLYMFRTVPLSIIRSISTLYTRSRYLSC